jgi:phosphate uptake regulator
MTSFQSCVGAIEFFQHPVRAIENTCTFLQTMDTIIAYYRARANEEDAIDHTYQLLQRTLKTVVWYSETVPAIHVAIGILLRLGDRIQMTNKEIQLLNEYFEYILFCLKQESAQ